MILKRGVARILGNGGGFDEMCAGQFIMVFFACTTNNIWMNWILTNFESGDLTKVTTGLSISIIFALKLSYSLFCTIGRSKNSVKTIIDQPTLILLPIFTFFTFSKMSVGCGGKKDLRLKLSKCFTLLNFLISTLISLAVGAFYFLSGIYGSQPVILMISDLYSIFLYFLSALMTFIYLYCDPSFGWCYSMKCCIGGQQLIHVYDPDNPDMEFVFKKGEVVRKEEQSISMESK